MRIARIAQCALAGTALLLAIGCSQNSSPNLKLDVMSTPNPAASKALAGGKVLAAGTSFPCANGTIVVQKAYIALKEIEFEQTLAVDGTDVDDFEFKGPYVVDLVNDTITPELGLIDLAAGEYQEIEYSVDKIELADISATGVDTLHPLASGSSIYVEGSFTPTGGAAVPFTFASDEDLEVELKPAGEGAKPFTVDDATVNNIIIAFRMNEWFAGIAFPADNPIRIDSAHQGGIVAGSGLTLLETLESRIERSADYGKDADGSGSLELDEDDDLID